MVRYVEDSIEIIDIISDDFYDNSRIAWYIWNEFDQLLESYGLGYNIGFKWGLTTYRLCE